MPGDWRGAGRSRAAPRSSDSDNRATGRHRRLATVGMASAAALLALPARAQDNPFSIIAGQMSLGVNDVVQLAVFAGVTGAAMFSAIWLIRERGRVAEENVVLRARVSDTAAALQRAEGLLGLKDQRHLVWQDDNARPEIVGSLPPSIGAPEDRATFLAFGRWLAPRSAAALEHAIRGLRDEGATFDLVVETHKGGLLEAQGRTASSWRAVRFLSLSQPQHEFAQLRSEHQRMRAEHESFVALADSLDAPCWLRGPDGRLAWVNAAYARAVDATSAEAAIHEGREFLATSAREAVAAHHRTSAVYADTLATVVGGDRRIYAVTDVAGPTGSAGIALDVSATETMRAENERTHESHAATLDQLNTAVAIFDERQKLRFFNQAFQKLWRLDIGFLESAPDNALLIDRLRSDGLLAEQPEWRRWKDQLLSAYRAMETQEHLWHLPDGRTLRVVATPQPRGGVTWVFENLTEKIHLESRYNAAIRVQGETLDNLAEGVAVFGPDGRVRLANPAFATLWRLPAWETGTGTHISAIRAAAEAVSRTSPWGELVAAVTGFDEERHDRNGQAELLDGTALRYAVIHLPNGHVMTTFVDVTDSVNVERALKDKNDALERADRLKNEFVQHVSYELRSPLTNIIGFTELLGHDTTGPLNPRQREYVGHISSSSSVLLTIVNDILDLATVDAGIMELEIGEVRVAEAVTSAADLVAERLKDHAIRLELDIARAPSTFQADENRIRQILFNLLSNAANYAPEGSTIRLSARSDDTSVVFTVHDDGPGMSQEVLETIFRRFEPRANGGRRRGAGLGLSIVKSFVELHGGTVRIDTSQGGGTTVSCVFPLAPEGLRRAAE
jgi:signal transduction histidine kinase